MTQKTEKITVSLPVDTLRLTEEKYKEFGFENRSAFIDAAIREYISRDLLRQNALGSISNERFSSLSAGYEREQQSLKEQLTELDGKVAKAQSDAQNAERFLALIKKYTELPELNAKVLNELIHRIVIYQAQTDENGHRTQRVDIFYKFVGLVKMEVD